MGEYRLTQRWSLIWLIQPVPGLRFLPIYGWKVVMVRSSCGSAGSSCGVAFIVFVDFRIGFVVYFSAIFDQNLGKTANSMFLAICANVHYNFCISEVVFEGSL